MIDREGWLELRLKASPAAKVQSKPAANTGDRLRTSYDSLILSNRTKNSVSQRALTIVLNAVSQLLYATATKDHNLLMIFKIQLLEYGRHPFTSNSRQDNYHRRP